MIKNIYFNKLCTNLYHNFRFPYPLSRIVSYDVKHDIKNWFYDNSLGIKICDECGEITECTVSGNQYNPYEGSYDDIDVEKVCDWWHKVFIHVCYYLGINFKSAEVLWENLTYENWEHLHQTEEEQQYSERDWFEKFYFDMFYCSDRWSLTRLERCHWKYRQWLRKKEKTM